MRKHFRTGFATKHLGVLSQSFRIPSERDKRETSCHFHWFLHVGPIWAIQSLNRCKWCGEEAKPCLVLHISPNPDWIKPVSPKSFQSRLPLKLLHTWTVYFTNICLWKWGGVTEGKEEGSVGGVWGWGRLWPQHNTPVTLSDVIINPSGKGSWQFSEVCH